jgi:DNA repair photolyase
MCDKLVEFKEKILFRFTIGSADSAVLKFWEPNAPSFEERLASLKWAYGQGFSTSVSCEPMLDDNIAAVVDAVSPFVTESIWIGKANRLKSQLSLNGYRDVETIRRAEELLSWQSDDNILKLYYQFKNHPLIQWKDSIRTVLTKHNVSLEQDRNVASSCVLGTAA